MTDDPQPTPQPTPALPPISGAQWARVLAVGGISLALGGGLLWLALQQSSDRMFVSLYGIVHALILAAAAALGFGALVLSIRSAPADRGGWATAACGLLAAAPGAWWLAGRLAAGEPDGVAIAVAGLAVLALAVRRRRQAMRAPAPA